MTDDGYRARLVCIEWHSNLWLKYGVPRERCEAMLLFCADVLDADYYGDDRPETDDPEIARMQRYLDAEFERNDSFVRFD